MISIRLQLNNIIHRSFPLKCKLQVASLTFWMLSAWGTWWRYQQLGLQKILVNTRIFFTSTVDNIDNINNFLLRERSQEVKLYIYVFAPSMQYWILWKLNRRAIIAVNKNWFLLSNIKLNQYLLQQNCLGSTQLQLQTLLL